MGKRFEDRVQEVRDAVRDPGAPQHRKCLIKTLGGRNGYLISLAMPALRSGDETFLDAARAAFDRLLADPVKRDPQCHGKVAIAQALYDADIASDTLFISGVAHVQLEPVMGGRQDTAAQLRGISLMALVHVQHPRALVCAAAMLADPERPARLAALRALTASGRQDIAEPLLRLRLGVGENDPEVLSECMSALLEVNGHDNVGLMAEYLAAGDTAAAQAAAVALGASRLPQALEILSTHVGTTVSPERRRTLILGLAMLRSDAAWQLLIEMVMEGSRGEAVDAIDALATFKEQPGLRERVQDAAMDRGDAEIQRSFEHSFGPE